MCFFSEHGKSNASITPDLPPSRHLYFLFSMCTTRSVWNQGKRKCGASCAACRQGQGTCLHQPRLISLPPCQRDGGKVVLRCRSTKKLISKTGIRRQGVPFLEKHGRWLRASQNPALQPNNTNEQGWLSIEKCHRQTIIVVRHSHTHSSRSPQVVITSFSNRSVLPLRHGWKAGEPLYTV